MADDNLASSVITSTLGTFRNEIIVFWIAAARSVAAMPSPTEPVFTLASPIRTTPGSFAAELTGVAGNDAWFAFCIEDVIPELGDDDVAGKLALDAAVAYICEASCTSR